MGVGQAEDLNIDVSRLSPSTEKLYAAGGNELRCYGTVNCDMTLGVITAKVMVSVIQGLDGALLSWHDSIALGILPSNFPAQVARVGPPPATADVPPPPPIATPPPPIAASLPPPRRGRRHRQPPDTASTVCDVSAAGDVSTTPSGSAPRPGEADGDASSHASSGIETSANVSPQLHSPVVQSVTQLDEDERLPSQQREPRMSDTPPSRVFESVSTDFFSHAGRAYIRVCR